VWRLDNIITEMPASTGVERSVLGSMLLDTYCCKYSVGVLDADCFTNKNNIAIFKATKELFLKGVIPDVVLVSEKLRSTDEYEDISGCAYLSELIENTASTSGSGIHYACEILLNKCVLRESIYTFYNAIKYAQKTEAISDTVLSTAEKRLIQFRKRLEKIGGDKVYDHGASVAEYVARIEKGMEHGEITPGLPVPMSSLQRVIGKIPKGKTTVVCGYEKGGKSRLIRALISHWINNGLGGIVHMLEEDVDDIHKCIFANRCEINTKSLRDGITQDELEKIKAQKEIYSTEPLYIDVKYKATLQHIKDVIEKQRVLFARAGKSFDFVVVDHILEMDEPTIENENEKHNYISTGLIEIAKKYNVAIIEIMQFVAETERINRRAALHSFIRFGKTYREKATIILTLDDRIGMKKKDDRIKYTALGWRPMRVHILEREGDSHGHVDVKAELNYSRFSDITREDDWDGVVTEPEAATGFFDGTPTEKKDDFPF